MLTTDSGPVSFDQLHQASNLISKMKNAFFVHTEMELRSRTPMVTERADRFTIWAIPAPR